MFPGIRAIGEPDEMEEERRLCYVAMTRAERKLHFTCARRRMIFGKTIASKPSRFVREIKYDNIEMKDMCESYSSNSGGDYEYYGGYERRTKHSQLSTSNYQLPTSKPQPPPPEYNTGDNVEHATFGQGIIKKITPAGGDALFEIEFDTHGVKRLMLKSASRYMVKIV